MMNCQFGRSIAQLLALILGFASYVVGSPVGNYESKTNVENSSGYFIFAAILSICVAMAAVAVIILCAPQCWPWKLIHRRREGLQSDPTSLNSPNTSLHNSRASLAQIDVRELELDPIVFEPLPTLQDMSDSGQVRRNEHSFVEKRNQFLVPFIPEESTIYAHDWFDEPFSNFSRGNIEYIREVGRGWFGKVIEAEAKDIVPYAKKIRVMVKVLREDATGLEQMRFLDEARIYRDSNHGNILRLLGHSIEITPFLLIMELYPLGNLKSYLVANVTRAELFNKRGDAVQMAIDVARALEWMSDIFVHADLAARNCLVGSEGRIVLGDYGLSTSIFRDDYYWSSNIAIPLRWAAPETIHCTMNTIQTLRVTKAANIWTFGIIIWEICEFGKQPYELTDDEVIRLVICEKTRTLNKPTMTTVQGDRLYTIMKSCWNSVPDERPSISNILHELESIYRDISLINSNKEDLDFDSKWVLLPSNNKQQASATISHTGISEAKNTNLLGDHSKKKSVRFSEITGGQQQQMNQVIAKSEIIGKRNDESLNTSSSNFPIPYIKDDTVDWKSNVEEEEIWSSKSELEEISEKVREKSQSVQDLMVLTHLDPGEYDSMPYNNDSIEGQHTRPHNSSISPVSISAQSFRGSTVSQVDGDLNHNTNIGAEISFEQTSIKAVQTAVGDAVRLKDETNTDLNSSHKLTNGTSETLNSTIPKISGEVCAPPNDFGSEGSFVQPHINEVVRSTSSTSIILGPNDELGLDYFQQVSTEIVDPNFSRMFLHSSNTKKPEPEANQRKETVAITKDCTKNNNCETVENNDSSPKEFVVSPDLVAVQDYTISSGVVAEVVDNFIKPELDSSNKDLNVISDSDSKCSASLQNGNSNDTAGTDDEFWSKQINSLKEATTHALGLFQLGLDSFDVEEKLQATAGEEGFDKEIKAAAEEYGSLVLHDLEDESKAGEVLEENRDVKNDIPNSLTTTCTAFGGEVQLRNSCETKSELDVEVDDEDEDETLNSWTFRNSIEVNKQYQPKSKGKEGDGDDNKVEEIKDFVPSKWNQSLVPVKPSIKSPEILEKEKDEQPLPLPNLSKTGLRKSVSFEKKKIQLVYEYPPPPPASDSEEEDKKHAKVNDRFALSLDWELHPDELLDETGQTEDWETDIVERSKRQKSIDSLYRISALDSEESSPVHPELEPESNFPVLGSRHLGELRHTRERLKLDLCSKGEASLLDDFKSSNKQDSGVGSSTNASPFGQCDN